MKQPYVHVTQHTAYLPYGELLVDEHSSSEEMPYKFNGEELDTDTKFNRLHEIFHTFGFEDYKKELARKGNGIMKYPPEKPIQQMLIL